MARIRTIKPEYATSGKILRLTDSTAFFFVLLWAHCDDFGFFSWDTLELSLKTGRWRAQEVFKFLSALVKAGLVRCSSSVGVGQVVGWEHQKIKDRRASKWNESEIVWDEIETDAPRSDKNRPVVECSGEERSGKECSRSQEAQPLVLAADPPEKKVVAESKTKATWEAYSAAYLNRHRTEPIRNKTVNSQMARFVDRVGVGEAPDIAAFYLTHNDQFYIRALHSVGILLRDAEKLRTEWATGRKVTSSQARQAEKTDYHVEQLAMIRRGEL